MGAPREKRVSPQCDNSRSDSSVELARLLVWNSLCFLPRRGGLWMNTLLTLGRVRHKSNGSS